LLAAATVGLLAVLAAGCAAPAVESSVTSVNTTFSPAPPDTVSASGTPSPASASRTVSGSSVAPGAGATSTGPSAVTGTDSTSVSAALSTSVPPAPNEPTAVRPEVPSSPLLFPQAEGTLTAEAAPGGSVTLNPIDGQTRDGEPYRPLAFTATNVWLAPTDGTTAFELAADAGESVGSATQVRVSYDLTGDGSWDRVETYRYFATDPLPGLELYTQDAGLLAAQGSLGDLTGGIVQLEVWSSLGDGGTTLDLAASSLQLPYS
jgi:hypothetical protein